MALKVKVLEQSFGQLKPHGTKFAASFYEKLFDDFPRLVPCLLIQTWKCKKKSCSGLYR